jgi:hypothetical protein
VADFPSLRQLFRSFKAEEGTDTQVESGIKCYVKPNRTEERRFTGQDAARIMCYAFKNGASEAEMLRRFRVTCKGETKERANQAEEAIALAMENVQLNTAQLLDEWKAFLIVNGILLGLIALLGVIQLAGPLRLVALPLRAGARVAQVQVAQMITRNIIQRAANDAVFDKLAIALKQAA